LRYSQPLTAPDALNPVLAHFHATVFKHGRHPAVAVAAIVRSNQNNVPGQFILEIWDGRAQVELRVKGEGVTEGWYGGLRTGLKGSTETGDGVSGVLASTTAFTVKSPTQGTAAFFGGDILFSPTDTIQIFAGGEAAVDGDTTDIQGRAGASIRF